MSTKIFYLRDDSNNPVGCVAATSQGNSLNVAYSLCSPHDRFNRQLARKIATERLTTGKGVGMTTETSIAADITNVRTTALQVLARHTSTERMDRLRQVIHRELQRDGERALQIL
jgi:hypothetical protein